MFIRVYVQICPYKRKTACVSHAWTIRQLFLSHTNLLLTLNDIYLCILNFLFYSCSWFSFLRVPFSTSLTIVSSSKIFFRNVWSRAWKLWGNCLFLAFAEISKGDDLIDVQVDRSTLDHIRQKTKTKSIRTTFRYSLSKFMFLFSYGLLLFSFRKSWVLYFVQQVFKSSTVNDFQRIHHISSWFWHLFTLTVTNHRMKKHLLEGKLICQP